MNISKYNSNGNSFIILDTPFSSLFKQSKDFIGKLAVKICDKSKGIGSDGIIVTSFIENKPHIRIFNSDGSEAEISGNALRITALYLLDNQYTSDTKIQIYTKGGKPNTLEIKDKAAGITSVELSGFSFLGREIPMVGFLDEEVLLKDIEIKGKTVKCTCVNVGNPHCVVFLDHVSRETVVELGPEIENHPLFPERINLEIVQALDRGNLRIEFWERGVGFTSSCGSGISSACFAAFRLGLVDSNIRVLLNGGEIMSVEVSENKVILEGKVNRVLMEGKISEDLI